MPVLFSDSPSLDITTIFLVEVGLAVVTLGALVLLPQGKQEKTLIRLLAAATESLVAALMNVSFVMSFFSIG